MASPVASRMPPPLVPAPLPLPRSPTPPTSTRPVIPRSQPPRPHSNPMPRPAKRPSISQTSSQPLTTSLTATSTPAAAGAAIVASASAPTTSGTAPPSSEPFAFDPSNPSSSSSASGSRRSSAPHTPATTAIGSSRPLSKKTRSSSSSSSSASGAPRSALSALPPLNASGHTSGGPAAVASPAAVSPAGVAGPSFSNAVNAMHSSTLLSQAVAAAASGTSLGAVGAGAGAAGPSGTSTPQTGAGKMAAAAKARAEGVGRRANTSDVVATPEEESHPLSEKSLRARDYQTVQTLSRLFHLPSRWRLVRPLGQGAYGLVIQVQDSFTGEFVAVKCITRVFDKVILARRALREITLLRHFGGHENLTGLIDLDNVWDGYNEIYLYMEPMEADLHQIVRSGQALSNAHIQYFTYQLLRGMKYIHSANVIHRDLKPGNLLVNADCELKICDFGLARGYRPARNGMEDGMRLTEYVATRWYRAPEVMLSNSSYTTAMDVWSIGCILAEVLGGKPLFKGKDYVDQINLILGALGSPDDETLNRIGSEKACAYMRTLPHRDPVDFKDILPEADPDAIDMLYLFLQFDPDKRSTVVQALDHPYVSTYHDEADEPSCPAVFDKWEQVESLETIEELRAAITREIEEFRVEVRTAGLEPEEEVMEMELEDEGDDEGETMWAYDEFGRPADGAAADLEEDPEGTIRPSGANGVVRSSPLAQYSDLGIGISPRTTTSALPLVPTRTRSPGTPLSVFSDDSSAGQRTTTITGIGAGNGPRSVSTSGRSSRRTSTHSLHQQGHSRRPNSFLFSSGLGAGMTPMSSLTANQPLAASTSMSTSAPPATSVGAGTAATAPGMANLAAVPGLGSDQTTLGHHSRSRAPSNTAEFASLRPLMRQLSTLGIEGPGARDELGRRVGEVPPMSVNSSDAPPSEAPKSFAPPRSRSGSPV